MKISFVTGFAFCAAFVLNSTLLADDALVAAKLAKIPAAAAEALKKAAGTAKIEKLATEKDGKVTVYEAELVEAGQPNREVSVTADGKLNAEEETVPLEKVPAAARAAIEAGAKGGRLDRIQRIKRAGGVTYEALYITKGKKTEVEYLEDGKLKPEEK
jgi:hypothetical protein